MSAYHRFLQQLHIACRERPSARNRMPTYSESEQQRNMKQTPFHLQATLEQLQTENKELLDIQAQLLANQRYAPALNFVSSAYLLTDQDARIVKANQSAAHWLALTPHQLQGKLLPLFIVKEERQLICKLLKRLTSAPGNFTLEGEVHMLPQNSTVPLPTTVTVAPLGGEKEKLLQVSWKIRDVPSGGLGEETLHQSNELLRSLFQAAPVAIIALDDEGKVTLWNPMAEQIFGWSEAEVIHQNITTVMEHQRDLLQEVLRQVGAGETVTTIETEPRTKAGTMVSATLSMSPIYDAQGDVQGTVVVIIDRTERKRVEKELSEARHRLADIRERERLRLAQDLHDDIVQQLHGLRYQLAEGRRRLRTTEASPERDNSWLQNHLEAIDRGILDVVGQLRDVITDLRPPGLEEFGLKTALEGYLAQLQRERGATLPEIKLQLECDQPLPHSVQLCIFRVVQESLRNVMQHAEASHAVVELRTEADGVCLTIHDNGCGFQLPERLTELSQSNHFGLIGIAEKVEAIGGELVIRSATGVGTTLQLWIPLENR